MKRIELIAYKHNFQVFKPKTYIGGMIALWQRLKGKKYWQYIHTAQLIHDDCVWIEADIDTGVEIYALEVDFERTKKNHSRKEILGFYELKCDYKLYANDDYDLVAIAEQLTGNIHAHKGKIYCSSLSAKLLGLDEWHKYMPADVVEWSKEKYKR